MTMQVVFPGGKRVSALYKGFAIETDQSLEGGGGGTAPEPFDLFIASIGTCAGIYVVNFCQSRNIPMEDARLDVTPERDSETGLVSKIHIHIQLPAAFPERYAAAITRVVGLCTVKKHLQSPPEFEIDASIGSFAGVAD